jgi:hypothetical protein
MGDIVSNKDDFRLLSNSSEFENRQLLFWGFDRKNIKKTSLYREFLANNKNLSFVVGDTTLQVKNELLTQTHKDVLEALLMFNSSFSSEKISVSNSSVMSFLDKNSKNVSWLFDILEELYNVNIRLFKENSSCDGTLADGFRILDTLTYDTKTGAIIFSFHSSFLAIYKNAKLFSYSKFTPFIANLDHDISKQVVRYLLTFDNLQIDIKKLLTVKLGLLNVVSARSLNNYVARIKEEDLSMYGIWVDGNNICIDRDKEVMFFDGVPVGDLEGLDKVKIKQSALPFFDLT